MGISPSSFGINNISNISRVVNSNSIIQETIKRVKRANNELARALTSVDMPGLRQGLNWYRGLQDACQFNPVYGIALGSQLGKYAAEEF